MQETKTYLHRTVAFPCQTGQGDYAAVHFVIEAVSALAETQVIHDAEHARYLNMVVMPNKV